MRAIKGNMESLVFGDEYKRFMEEGGYDFFDNDGNPLAKGDLEERAQKEIEEYTISIDLSEIIKSVMEQKP